jgi:hypothetical protein
MSVRLGAELPDELFYRLNGRMNGPMDGGPIDPRLKQVILLITLDEGGWPYGAMLSYLEVIATDRRTLRLAPWTNSTTTGNLRRNGKAALLVIEEGLAYYVQGTAAELEREMEGFPGMAKIEVRIDAILQDNALDYEGAARITSGIRFENPDLDAARIEHGKRVLEELRK